MPYRGDSVLEGWEYWFDEFPSKAACLALEVLGRDYPGTMIVEAMEITCSMLITEEAARLQYITGILRRKTLESVAPDRADEEHKIDRILRAWKKVFGDRYTTSPSRAMLAEWLQHCTDVEILSVLRVARDWPDFQTEVEKIIETRSRGSTASDGR